VSALPASLAVGPVPGPPPAPPAPLPASLLVVAPLAPPAPLLVAAPAFERVVPLHADPPHTSTQTEMTAEPTRVARW
jgi:hypothetical protein